MVPTISLKNIYEHGIFLVGVVASNFSSVSLKIFSEKQRLEWKEHIKSTKVDSQLDDIEFCHKMYSRNNTSLNISREKFQNLFIFFEIL